MATFDPTDFQNLTSPYCVNCSNSTVEPTVDPDEAYISFILNVLSIAIPVLFSLIAVIGIGGNLLVIIVVVSNKQMRNSTNMLILNLALADMFFIVICVPFTAVGYVMPQWPFGDAFCKFYNYMIYVTAYASMYTLVMMSIDRYLAVCHPIWSMGIRTEKNTLIVIIASWFVITLSTIPILFKHGVRIIVDDKMQLCILISAFEEDNEGGTPYHSRVFYSCFFVFGYLLPLAMVCILYGLLLKRLLCGMKPGGCQSAESMRGKKRVTKMVVIVICTFAICWLPLHMRYLIHFFGKYHENAAFYIFQVIATCMAYANSCVNPILYAFLSENFRKSFRKLLCCYSNFQPMHMEYERTQMQPKERIEFSKTYTTTMGVDNNCKIENNGETPCNENLIKT